MLRRKIICKNYFFFFLDYILVDPVNIYIYSFYVVHNTSMSKQEANELSVSLMSQNLIYIAYIHM